ncbi:hypothetical protein ABER99_21880 [Paenibacillus glucanolyticus]|jgi:hypothetical protein|uniref:Uncharacterized protein n=1 Tax=Paenibacillus glucanolyticus TaxID=59843 RepID=A0A163GP61_9BACL|nr:hypothetical protein [Paenibacillus glucanolyticus]KZS45072.1 hypothetical protein AWU65_03575 [Paenibacillus glucanolyticus]OMF63644.1 hypothetical protein BK142_32545 [Paenibacillus glucanolyticus]
MSENNLLYQSIKLGVNPETGEDIVWPWNQEEHSTMTIVGDDLKSPRKKLVERIISEVQSMKLGSVYQILDSVVLKGELMESDAILWTESLPDPPEDYEDRENFINNRRYFSTSYFNLFAQSKMITRPELLPPTSYRWNYEGPLFGYLRAIERLDDGHPYKNDLKIEMEKLTRVEWYQSADAGRIFYLDQHENIYNKALSFLRAVWSFWAIVGKLDEPTQMLLVVEVPHQLIDINLEPKIAEIINFSFNILRYLTYETTVTLLLSSDKLNPAPENHFRHKLIFTASKHTDFDLTSEGIKEYVNPILFETWESGDNSAGIHFDDHIPTQSVLIPLIDIPST